MRLRNLKQILTHECVVVDNKFKTCKCVNPLFVGKMKDCEGDFLDKRVDKIYHGSYLNDKKILVDALYIFIV